MSSRDNSQHFKLTAFPNSPGVYLIRNARGKIIYIGKASSIKKRVSFYFKKAADNKTAALMSEIKKIDWQKTDSILEATILEAHLIKKYQPKYNIKAKDDRSFLYIVITRDEYPKILVKRGKEIMIKNSKSQIRNPKKIPNPKSQTQKYTVIYGPFTNQEIVRSILKLVRKIFPWSNCKPNQNKPCFYYHLKQCPGICVGKIRAQEYQKTIRNIILFFQGRKKFVINNIKKEMDKLTAQQKFEQAAILRDQSYHLEHIQDVGLIKTVGTGHCPVPTMQCPVRTIGRIEGFDISNISGKYATGSMAVFKNGKADKSQYRRFKIKTVKNQNDIKMLQEIIKRRFKHKEWQIPDLILVDGGRAQVNVVIKILKLLNLTVPIVGIAKGAARKKTDFIFGPMNHKAKQNINQNKNLMIQIRDEAHRFALFYHRKLRKLTFI